MKLGVDANGVTSALIANSTRQEPIVTLHLLYLTLAVVSTKSSKDVIVEKSVMDCFVETRSG